MILEEGEVLVGDAYQIPDKLWDRIKLLLPPLKPKKKSGRPRMDDRLAMNAVFYVLRTGCQWKALPRCLGAPCTVHDRFQGWCKADVSQKLWEMGLVEYDIERKLDWKWQVMDGAITKAPLGGKAQVPTLRIGVSVEPSVASSWKETAYLSDWSWTVRIDMI